MSVQYEYSKLPKETTSHFSRDTTDVLLWFTSPPVNITGGGGATYSTTLNKLPHYSLEYLHWRATKTGNQGDSDIQKASDDIQSRLSN
ncbi:RSC complex protein [Lentinula edodes]|uniref:RSC complex protein n=1 Tax=Lentinula edodes TaxID=5353 RepID=A0A1Q3E207_LENED|nr:uncharacterized protein C8R40DRAFT_646809 [Lentinula edodes]KAH7870418.1 hypothetical protein C8R40DRAFT_646809 [Lentinula edodes]GAW01260.1 RSC complex protein [Lentinula edodes]